MQRHCFVVCYPDLSLDAEAHFVLAGLTMYSAIKKTNLKQGDWLVITGAGGGSGH